MDETLKSHFLNLYALALSDNDVDSRELAYLYQLGLEKGVEKDNLKDLIVNPDKVSFTVPKDIEKKVEYLYDLAQMVLADGYIDEEEKRTLKKFCRKFGFAEQNVEGIANYLLNSVSNNIPKQDILNEIKEAHE